GGDSFPKEERRSQCRFKPWTRSSTLATKVEISVRIRLFPWTCSLRLPVIDARFSRERLRFEMTWLRLVLTLETRASLERKVCVSVVFKFVGMSNSPSDPGGPSWAV